MINIEITFDEETGFYDALLLEKGIATQAKSLDELVKNISEAMGLSKEKKSFLLKKFNFSFQDNYVNI